MDRSFYLGSQVGLRLGNAPAAQGGRNARQKSQEKRQPPAPARHRLLTQGLLERKADQLGQEVADLRGRRDEDDAAGKALLGAHLGEVCGDGRDLATS